MSVVEHILRVKNEAGPGLKDATADANKLADATKRVDSATKGFGDAAGKAGGSVQKLAGAAGMVSSEAGGAVGNLADVADVIEVGAAAAALMGPAVILVVAALGALAVASITTAAETKKVEEHLAAMKKDAEEAAPALRALRDVQIDLAVAMGTLTKEQADAMKGATAAQDDYVASVADNTVATTKLYAEQAALEKQIARLQERQNAGAGGNDARDARLAGEAVTLEKLRGKLVEVTAEIDRNNTVVGKAAGTFVDRVTEEENLALALTATREEEEKAKAAKEAAAAASKAAAAASKAAAEGARDEAASYAGQADFIARVAAAQEKRLAESAADFEEMYAPAVDQAAEALREFYDALAGVVPPKALTDLEKLGLAEADITLAFSRGKISVEQYTAAIEALNEARASGKATAQDVAGGVGGVASGLSGGLGGVPSAMASGAELATMAGATGTAAGLAASVPIVAAIVAIIDLVTAIVPGEGETGLLDGMHDKVMEFFDDLGGLGKAIGSFIEDTIREGIPAFINALPALFQGIFDAIPGIIDALLDSIGVSIQGTITNLTEHLPAIVGGLIDAIVDAIPQIVGGIVRMLVEAIGNIADALIKMFTQVFADLFGLGEGEGKTFNQGGIFDQIFTGKKEAANGTAGPGLFEKGGWFDEAGKSTAAWVDKFDTGSDGIARTGLALVHQGERIVNATGTSSGVTSSMSSRGGGAAPNIFLPPGMILGTSEDLAREFARQSGRGIGWAG